MKPIIIKTQDGINVFTTVKELEENIQIIYEQGVEDGKLQERASKNTQSIVYRDSSKTDWCKVTSCDAISMDAKKQKPTVEYI